MKFFRHYKQSITLLVIAAVLLVIAFNISQQTRDNDQKPRLVVSPNLNDSAMNDMPDCRRLTSVLEELSCYAEAAQVSEAWVLEIVDEISQMEPDQGRRVAFIETQFAWEEGRDAECEFLRGAVEDEERAVLETLRCITEQNLDRLERLEYYRDEWYCEEGCASESETSQ